MLVTNNTREPLIALHWSIPYGYSKDVTIEPGEEVNVPGPYIGEMGGESCYKVIEGHIICHEAPDDDSGFQVLKGSPLCMGDYETGLVVRHHSEEPEKCVVEWRRKTPDSKQ